MAAQRLRRDAGGDRVARLGLGAVRGQQGEGDCKGSGTGADKRAHATTFVKKEMHYCMLGSPGQHAGIQERVHTVKFGNFQQSYRSLSPAGPVVRAPPSRGTVYYDYSLVRIHGCV
jgi:hypothetical protein